MKPIVDAITSDLLGFGGELLEAGLAPWSRMRLACGSGSASCSWLMNLVEELWQLAPNVLAESSVSDTAIHAQHWQTRTPLHSTPSRRPSDWQMADSTLLPRHWDSIQAEATADPRLLAYMLHVMQRLAADFAAVRSRLERHIEESRIARAGTSTFSQQDEQALVHMTQDLRHGAAQIERAIQEVHRTAGKRLVPSDREPRPGPRGPAWSAFRRLARGILEPGKAMPAGALGASLRGPVHVADLPFLYQRWVGVRLVRELQDGFGFMISGDPVGPLFLGGCIPMFRAGTQLHLWCEPRLGEQPHPSGLITTSLAESNREATPDYVLVTPGSGGPDAFVLDATLSHDPTLVERKSRYRERLAFQEFRLAAGVPGRRRPLRSWAAVPIYGASHNQLARPDGSCGVIPMQPDQFDPKPLRAWLQDAVDHGDAWRLLATEHARET
ncbi:MAG: hypothetical protein JNK49_21660 [Planctomycetes bacterium]|nr:hypothetical protein [Planctomycetota bacterium]